LPPTRASRAARRQRTDAAKAIAASLLAASARPSCWAMPPRTMRNASSLLALANWIGAQTGATVGYLTEAANTVGAQLVGALPGGTAASTPARCWPAGSRP
jgi:NADH-quinone oxidoreductase subunit G